MIVVVVVMVGDGGDGGEGGGVKSGGCGCVRSDLDSVVKVEVLVVLKNSSNGC